MNVRSGAAGVAVMVVCALTVLVGPGRASSACSCPTLSESEALEIADAVFDVERVYEGSAIPAELGDGSSPTSGGSESSASSGEDEAGIPGVVFAIAFVVFGVGLAAVGTIVVQRRRYRPIPDD